MSHESTNNFQEAVLYKFEYWLLQVESTISLLQAAPSYPTKVMTYESTNNNNNNSSVESLTH